MHLDTFPYAGCTTTCDALWMGVPTVTRAGDAYVSRVGASILSQVGLGDLVAGSADGYVAAAVALANDVPRLVALRATLRSTLAESPLGDAAGVARAFEAGLRRAWGAWCVAGN